MNYINERERPASKVLTDIEKRLDSLNERGSGELPKTTLDLGEVIDTAPQALKKTAETLLTPKNFESAYLLYDPLKRSADITENKN